MVNKTHRLSTLTKSCIQKFEKTIIKNKYDLILSVFFSLIYVLPLLLANIYYRDDLIRSVNGIGWDYDGRQISTFIMSKFTGGGYITDYFPYSQFFAAIIIAIAGNILCSIIGLEKERKIKISSLILLINPFFLENLSYRWDAIPMSISILSVIFPFLYVNSSWRFVLASSLGIFITMFTYQASLPIYLLMSLILMVNRCFDGDNKIFKLIILTGIGFIIGVFLYKLVVYVKQINLLDRDSTFFFNDHFLFLFKRNVNSAFVLIKSIFSRYFMAISILSILFAIAGYTNFLKSNKHLICKVLIPILSIFIIIIIPITIISLDIIESPRILTTFPFFIYLILIFIKNLSRTITPYISAMFIFMSFSLMSTYANALRCQNMLNINICRKIEQTVDLKDKQIAFIGEIMYAPEVYRTIEKFPVLEYLIPRYLGDNVWDLGYLAKMNNYMYGQPKLEHLNQTEIDNIKESLPIIDETFYYVLRADSATVLIDFKISKSQNTEIIAPTV